MKTSFALLMTTLTLAVSARRSPSTCQYPDRMGEFCRFFLLYVIVNPRNKSEKNEAKFAAYISHKHVNGIVLFSY